MGPVRAKNDSPAKETRLAELRDRLIGQGPESLDAQERMALLSDLDSMVSLHETIWAAPSTRLAGAWQRALRHYAVVAAPPETAFRRVA